jgi:hypothetical protein
MGQCGTALLEITVGVGRVGLPPHIREVQQPRRLPLLRLDFAPDLGRSRYPLHEAKVKK